MTGLRVGRAVSVELIEHAQFDLDGMLIRELAEMARRKIGTGWTGRARWIRRDRQFAYFVMDIEVPR